MISYMLNGAIPSNTDDRDYKISRLINVSEINEETYVSDAQYIVYNQGSIGCCVACSLAGCRTIQQFKETNKSEKYSVIYIYGNRESDMYQGEGMCPRDALKMLCKYGTPLFEDCSGYLSFEKAKDKINSNREVLDKLAYPNRISTYYNLSSENEIKTAIKNLGCISVMIPVYNCTYYPDGNGIINYIKGQEVEGYHQIIVIGWNKTGWIAINSWDETWGIGGTFIFPYDYPIQEAWAMTDDIIENNISEENVKSQNIFMRILFYIKKYFNKLVKKIL